MRRLLLVVPVLVALAGAAPAPAATLVRLDGVGPLKLGMSQAGALGTGWLAGRTKGCELAVPRPVGFTFTGSKAPAGLTGNVEFTSGKLTNFSYSKGARTANGTQPGKTTWPTMVKRYRADGYKVSAIYEETFASTIVTVKRKSGKQVLSAFASGKVIEIIGMPSVPVCE